MALAIAVPADAQQKGKGHKSAPPSGSAIATTDENGAGTTVGGGVSLLLAPQASK